MEIVETQRRKVYFCTALGALLLLIPVLWNKAPLVYFDTGAYLARGDTIIQILFPNYSLDTIAPIDLVKLQEVGRSSGDAAPLDDSLGIVMDGRSVYYGIPASLSKEFTNSWMTVIVQVLSLSFVSALLMRVLYPYFSIVAFGVIMSVTSLLTPAAIFSGLVMPDIWVMIGAIGAGLLMLAWDRLSIAERVASALFLVFALVTHNSHLLMLVGVLCIMLVIWIMGPRVGRIVFAKGYASVMACVFVGFLCVLAFYVTVEKMTGKPPVSFPYLTAHLVDAEVGARYARDVCGSDTYRICKHLDNLPTHWQSFIFSKEPDYGVYAFEDDNGKRMLSDEQWRFAYGTFTAYPLETAVVFIKGFFEQLMLVSPLGTPLTERNEAFLDYHFEPHVAAQTKQTRVYNWEGILVYNGYLSLGTLLISTLFLAGVLLHRAHNKIMQSYKVETLSDRHFAFILFFVAVFVTNAVICGGIIYPYDRFQARLVALIPLIEMVTFYSLWSARFRVSLTR